MSKRKKLMARFFIVLFVLFSFLGCSHPKAGSSAVDQPLQASRLKTEDIPIQLGETTVVLRKTTALSGGRSHCFIVLHDNENTASCAARSFLETAPNGGVLFELVHDGSRYVSFAAKSGNRVRFDPNRIFTEKGLQATLKDENPGKGYETNAEVMAEVKKLEQTISRQIAPFKAIVAVHNNTDNRYSIASYEIAASSPGSPNEAGRGNTRKLEGGNPAYASAGDPLVKDVDNFILVTQKSDFEKLKGNYNVVLQTENGDSTAGQGVGPFDDGSLSIRRKSERYFNIEVQHRVVTIDRKCGDAPCEVGVAPPACGSGGPSREKDPGLSDQLLILQVKMIAAIDKIIANEP